MVSILIIDDDEVNNYVTKHILKKWKSDCEINIASNGAIGIKYLEQGIKSGIVPDLLLLDINMPLMDGFEFLEKFYSMELTRKKEVVIIVLTTSSDHRDKERMKELGIKNFLYKPLTIEGVSKLMSEFGHLDSL